MNIIVKIAICQLEKNSPETKEIYLFDEYIDGTCKSGSFGYGFIYKNRIESVGKMVGSKVKTKNLDNAPLFQQLYGVALNKLLVNYKNQILNPIYKVLCYQIPTNAELMV